MMRRRAVPARRGGVLGTMARTAVIAGTATVTSQAVSGAMHNRADQRALQQEAQTVAEAQQAQAQQDVAEIKAQMEQMQAREASSHLQPPAAEQPDLLAQLERLGELHQSGLLSSQEFETAKARLLA